MKLVRLLAPKGFRAFLAFCPVLNGDFWSAKETVDLWDRFLQLSFAKVYENETIVVCVLWWHIITKICFLRGILALGNLLTPTTDLFLVGQ